MFIKELTKEQYQNIKKAKSLTEQYKIANLGIDFIYGYGVKTFDIKEENGKYILYYDSYDNCD